MRVWHGHRQTLACQRTPQIADSYPVFERRVMKRRILKQLTTAWRCDGVDAPLISSETTMGERITTPFANASSTSGASAPAKKSIQTDVSMTMPATGLLQIDLQPDPAPQSNCSVKEALPPNLDQPLHDRFSDAFPRHFHRGVEKLVWKVGCDAACRHDPHPNCRMNDRQHGCLPKLER